MSDRFRSRLLEARRVNKPLIAVHRGTSSGMVQENTSAAVKAAVMSGADIVEIDVLRSKDGDYFTFHDGYEACRLNRPDSLKHLSSSEIRDRWYQQYGSYELGRVETVQSVLADNREIFINIDRSERYWCDGFLDDLAKWGDPEMMILKSNPSAESIHHLIQAASAFPYIGIVRTGEDLEAGLSRSDDVNLVGFEILAADSESELLDPNLLSELRRSGFAIWFNAINLEDNRALCAGMDDETSIFVSPDAGWGKLRDLGADIIQTDWPWLLERYLSE